MVFIELHVNRGLHMVNVNPYEVLTYFGILHNACDAYNFSVSRLQGTVYSCNIWIFAAPS
jgi:hypothetical protein